jgi:NAD(P)H-dependent FMN reductase
MTRIGIIIGSTRPDRVGEQVGEWVASQAQRRSDAVYELVDLQEVDLPLLDESVPPSLGQYEHDHTKRWAEIVGRYDGYVFVTAEYQHSIPAALKNALDYLYAEWNNKAAGIVSYGSALGARAAEALRLVCGELQIADVRGQVLLSLFTDFEDMSDFRPAGRHTEDLSAMLDQVVTWAVALQPVRAQGDLAAS